MTAQLDMVSHSGGCLGAWMPEAIDIHLCVLVLLDAMFHDSGRDIPDLSLDDRHWTRPTLFIFTHLFRDIGHLHIMMHIVYRLNIKLNVQCDHHHSNKCSVSQHKLPRFIPLTIDLLYCTQGGLLDRQG